MEKIFVSKIENLKLARAFIYEVLNDYNTPSAVIGKAQVIAEEILSNIIKYGYCDTLTISSLINLKLTISASNTIIMKFIDTGSGFNPINYNYDTEKRDIGGMGIKIVKNLSKEMTYKRKNDKNILTIYILGQ